MRKNLPPIWKDAQRVRAAVEQVVKRFNRFHRFASGSDLRVAAKDCVQKVRAACWAKDLRRRIVLARALSDAIDNLKDEMQLAKDVDAFPSFAEFEALARLVTGLGRQCGGWLKEMENQGQNAPASPAQRAQTLSSRAASPAGAAP